MRSIKGKNIKLIYKTIFLLQKIQNGGRPTYRTLGKYDMIKQFFIVLYGIEQSILRVLQYHISNILLWFYHDSTHNVTVWPVESQDGPTDHNANPFLAISYSSAPFEK